MQHNYAKDVGMILEQYGAKLQGVVTDAVDRVMMMPSESRLVGAERECMAFQKEIQSWIDGFQGTESEKASLTQFLSVAEGVFRESLAKALAEEIPQPTFQEQLKEARDSKPRYKYSTLEELFVAVSDSEKDHIDWSIARANEIVEVVTIATNTAQTGKKLVGVFDKAVSKIRVQMWDRIRPYKQHAPEEVISAWVNNQVAGAVHYATVILNGVSRNKLASKSQSEVFEKHLINVRQKYAKELNMNNADENNAENTNAASNNEAAQQPTSTEETTVNNNAENNTAETAATEETAMNNQATGTESTTEAPAKEGFFKRMFGKVKKAKDTVVEKAKAVDWKKVGKYAIVSLAFLLALALVLFGLKKAKESSAEVKIETPDVDMPEGATVGSFAESAGKFLTAIINGVKAGAAWVFNALARGFKAVGEFFGRKTEEAGDTVADPVAAAV